MVTNCFLPQSEFVFKNTNSISKFNAVLLYIDSGLVGVHW